MSIIKLKLNDLWRKMKRKERKEKEINTSNSIQESIFNSID